MADFCTVDDVASFLQVSITTAAQIAAAERAVTEAAAAIRNYTNQYLELVEDETIMLDSRGGTRLFLPELPVTEVTEVVEDDDTLVVTTDYKLGQWGILHRVGGAKWDKGIQIIEVTYSHGYAILPDDIIAIATRAAARAYQAGLRAAEGDAIPGISSRALGDFSVSYTAETGGGVSEGVLGASAARLLLFSERDILNAYKV
jgi:hypothetical protein